MKIKAGATNVSVYYYIVQDASGTSPGEPVTGLLFSDIETGGSASYARQGAARVDLTLITLASASATHADGGFILVDDTNMPGLYRCDYPNAAFAASVDQVFLQIVVASANNAVAAPILVDIDGNIDQTGDSFARIGVNGAGLTNINLPNQTMDITGSITGNLSGSVGSVTAINTTGGAIDNVTTVATTTTNTDMRGTDSAFLAANAPTNFSSLGISVGGAIDNVTLVATTTINTDMRGTDSALLAANINLTAGAVDNVTLVATTTTNTDMRGTDGANTVVPDAAGVAPTAVENRQEMDSNSVDLNAIQANQTTINTNVLAIDTAPMRGTDGVDTATMRGTDGANTVVPDAAGTAPTVVEILTTQMTESYAADAVAPTLAQALFLIQQTIGDFSIAGTTITTKQIDGSTTAATYALDDGTNPTSRTRAT